VVEVTRDDFGLGDVRCIRVYGEPPVWRPGPLRALARYRSKTSRNEWALIDWGWGQGIAALIEITVEHDHLRRMVHIETFRLYHLLPKY
jgi:hypothetical protein